LAPVLIKNCPSIRYISLTRNRFDLPGAEGLGEILRFNPPNLEEVYFGDNHLTNAIFQNLLPILKHPSLRRVVLSDNHMLATETTMFRTATQGYETAFDGNPIWDPGAEQLAEVIASNPPLEELRITNGRIGDTGAAAIGKDLRSNTHLKELSLVRNRISDAGAIEIAKALQSNIHLKSVCLMSNQIGEEGGQALLDAVQVNTSIRSLTLLDNPVSYFGSRVTDTLSDLLKGRRQLHRRD
jgi:Ran GTPase-activating protein (RanGAP) involved in mRNA processing and transport